MDGTVALKSNTVPIEKGTETGISHASAASYEQSNTVPIEKGTETHLAQNLQFPRRPKATPSPSRRGLKLNHREGGTGFTDESNTVPIEKGTETVMRATSTAISISDRAR